MPAFDEFAWSKIFKTFVSSSAMKFGFSVLIFILLALASHGQVVWEKNWGGPYDDGSEVRNTRDGGMIVMATSGIHSWLMRLDANGDTIWTRELRIPFDFGSVTETYDGGFIASGVTRYVNRDLVAMKFDHRGDSLWLRVYPDSLFTEGTYSVFPQPDSTFLLTGYTSANSYDMLVVKIDSLGNQIWRKTYGSPDSEGGTQAALTADGGSILTTTKGNFNTFIYVVKIDTNGDTLWTRNVSEPYPTGGPIPMVDGLGRIWIVGWINHVDYNNYIVCLDSNGSRLWSKEYLGMGFESRTARGLIEDRLGGYSFACSIDHAYGPPAGHDIALMRVDSLGNILRMHRLGHPLDEMPRYFEQAANGDYLFVGYSSSFATLGTQSYLARLNPMGCGEYLYDFEANLVQESCPGDTIWLDAGSGYLQYLWSDGDTNQIRPILQTDTFFVQVTDSLGCLNYSNAVFVEVHPMPSFTWTQNGTYTLDFDGTVENGSTFEWDFGDGMRDSLLDPQHTFPGAGSYWVCLTVTIDTCNPVQICDSIHLVQPIGVSELQVNAFQIYPNPGMTQVSFKNAGLATMKFKITTTLGDTRVEDQLSGQSSTIWDFSEWASGIYWVTWQIENGKAFHQKLVISH